MIWFILSVLTAFLTSVKSVFIKKSVSAKNIDEYVVAWVSALFAVPFSLAVLFAIGLPDIYKMFWPALVIGGTLTVVWLVLMAKAIKYSDLSLAMPLLAFSPLFVVATAPFIVKEIPNLFGLVGVSLIVLGAYTLNIQERRKGFLAPFKILFKEKGAVLMLIVAFIGGLSGSFDKMGIVNSSAIFWVFASNAFAAATLFILLMLRKNNHLKQFSSNLSILILIGIIAGISQISQMTATGLTLVAYVVAVKRTSIVISVLLGWLIFKEKNIRERLMGALIMLAGVLFIVFS